MKSKCEVTVKLKIDKYIHGQDMSYFTDEDVIFTWIVLSVDKSRIPYLVVPPL